MHSKTSVTLQAPYLLFIGDTNSLVYAKTAAGILQWRPDLVAGQLRFEGNQMDLGVQDLSIDQAVAAGVKSIIVGVAPVGGVVSDEWITVLENAAKRGLDVVSGLHIDLNDYPKLAEAALQSGSKLINVRTPPKSLPVGNGKKRSGKRLLTVGTDCAVGKKYTALALTEELKKQAIDASFCATGQTGIMIAGSGIPIDAVVSDFISGAAECVSPDNHSNHWDVIEGQGSLFHPSYAGVSLGLLHGSQPDAIVVCHDPSRETIAGCDSFGVPTVKDCIAENLRCARLTNPNVVCVGVSVNTSQLAPNSRTKYLQELSAELDLPCVDPLVDGCSDIVLNIIKRVR